MREDKDAGSKDERIKQAEQEELDGLPPKERFRKTTHIALLLTYDLIDKLRYWEKETLDLTDQEVETRQKHMTRSIEKLREAYSTFADLDY